jgi:hypothetical protein
MELRIIYTSKTKILNQINIYKKYYGLVPEVTDSSGSVQLAKKNTEHGVYLIKISASIPS